MVTTRRGVLGLVGSVIVGGCASVEDQFEGSSNEEPTEENTHSVEPTHTVERTVGIEISDEELENRSDRIINTVDELEALVEEEPANEVIGVTQPDEAFASGRWIDFNESHITILFQSPFTTQGDPVLTVESGAHVGGLRFGESQAVEDIHVINFGFDGNFDNQDQTIENLNAVHFEDVRDFTVDHAHIQNTSPHHTEIGLDAHGGGGEGINIESKCSEYVITNIHGEHIGDQLVQARGEDGFVSNITELYGFDRTVSVSFCDNVHVENVAAIHNKDGAVVGFSGSTGCSVNGVYGFDCRNVITVSNESEGTTISDVLAEETAHTAIDVRNGSQNTIVDDVTITDYEAQQRIAVQVNNGAGNVEFSNFDIHSQRGRWIIDVKYDADGDVLFRDFTITSDGSGNIGRVIRDGYGATYENMSIDVGSVGQGEEIVIFEESDGATFTNMEWDETIEDNGTDTSIN